mmetsp:Transcript_69651/g.105198  ORF Transcript_69651/g.105198 Transcript_69651/m.105198 type:complete len:88 (-) Transcript_69651:7-270(-)
MNFSYSFSSLSPSAFTFFCISVSKLTTFRIGFAVESDDVLLPTACTAASEVMQTTNRKKDLLMAVCRSYSVRIMEPHGTAPDNPPVP